MALLGLSLLLAVAGCGGTVRIRPVLGPESGGEKLPVHLALYVPPEESKKLFSLEDPEGKRAPLHIPVGAALAELTQAHLERVCEEVESVSEAKAPLDPEREALLVEWESVDFRAESPESVEWSVSARVSDALRLRYYRVYTGTGRASAINERLVGSGWKPLEKAVNAAMIDIISQLWRDLNAELASEEAREAPYFH
jgi:hypothetical protein